MQLKEIKTIKIVPYTLMNSSLNAVWAFIYAVLLLIFSFGLGATLPVELESFKAMITGISVAGLVVFPLGTFLINIVPAFLTALIYNGLTERLGGIKLSLLNMGKIESFDVISTSLIISAVLAVLSFIFQLLLSPLQWAFFSAFANILTMSGSSAATAMPVIQSFGAVGVLINIVITPIITFIAVFIGVAIVTILYNALAPKLAMIELNLKEDVDGFTRIESVGVVSLGLIAGFIWGFFAFILGLLILAATIFSGDYLVGIIALVMYTVTGFIGMFITAGLMALFYNLLAPRIGAVKVRME